MAEPGPRGFTARSAAVALALREGKTNREIGRDLGISQHTIAGHVRNILYLIGAKNRTEAAAWVQHNADWLRRKTVHTAAEAAETKEV